MYSIKDDQDWALRHYSPTFPFAKWGPVSKWGSRFAFKFCYWI